MKRFLLVVAMVIVLSALVSCGAQKTEISQGIDLYKAGDCEAAIPHLDAAIANPEVTMDVAYAYYLKGQCAEKAGDAAKAYEYYYAAKRITCYEIGNERNTVYNTYGRSEFCQRILPEKLKALAPTVGKEQIQTITAKMDEQLNDRYMERFQKRLSE